MTKEEKIIINTKIAKLFGWHSFSVDSVSRHGKQMHLGFVAGETRWAQEVPDYCYSADGFDKLAESLYCNGVYFELRCGHDIPGASARIVITKFPKTYRGYSGGSLYEALAQAVVKMIEDESNKEYLASWK